LGRRLAARALLEGHHRDIGVIELDPNDGEAAPGRRVGCRAYLEQAGIPWSTVHVAVGHGTTRDGYAAASRLLTDHPWLTGLVCGNDCMAMGAYAAIREQGLRVREDVAVIGIDDQELIADQVHPALTPVAQPFEEMGQGAGTLQGGREGTRERGAGEGLARSGGADQGGPACGDEAEGDAVDQCRAARAHHQRFENDCHMQTLGASDNDLQ